MKSDKMPAVATESEAAPKKKYDDWEVKDAADTIVRAHEHMANKPLMKHVHKHLSKKIKAMRSVADLKKAYKDKYEGGAQDPSEPDADD